MEPENSTTEGHMFSKALHNVLCSNIELYNGKNETMNSYITFWDCSCSPLVATACRMQFILG